MTPENPIPRAADWSARTATDYTSVLLELARAQRGFLFYSETDGRRAPLAERAHRAVRSELDRAGALELELAPLEGGFLLPGAGTGVDVSGPTIDFEKALRSHGVTKLRLDPTITRTALTGLFDLLSRGQDRFPSAEHFARTLAARDSEGIRINDIEPPPPNTDRDLLSTPARASASLAAALTTPAHEAPTQHAHEDEKPLLHEAPLEVAAGDERGERLRARLVELDATMEDDRYRERVADIVVWTDDVWQQDLVDEAYRSMLVLADHAVGSGGRSEVQARAAAASFATLAQGDRLTDLIDRATDSGTAGVRAAQLLLQLGDAAVPAVLDRLAEAIEDDALAAPLRALIVTQGETALPSILAAIEGHDERRARIGIRLAGELQNPVVLPSLIRSLRSADLSRRIETIRALSFLPGEESKQALTDALTSDLEEIASAASEALATADGNEAVPALLDVLEASVHTSRTKLGCTLVEVLGRLGDERAVPRLCAILERRPMLRRAHWHAIQLVTIDALSVLPTKEARRCIERAARSAPQSIRGRAREALARIADPDAD